MKGPRASFSTLLLIGAFVLLAAIGIGTGMGNRVLGQIGAHVPVQPTPVPAVTDIPDQPGALGGWKRTSVMAVATDPGFPDPRVTPEPEVPATARPTPRESRPLDTPHPNNGYTSPPLPFALPSHTPQGPETPGPDIEATPSPAVRTPAGQARPTPRYATMPPVSPPTLNP